MVRYSRALSPALVGRRVVVRYASAGGRHTDAVGDLLGWRDGVLTVRTRRGDVRVAEDDVVAGKPVPAPRLRRAADASVPQLQRIRDPDACAAGEWVGGWLLRPGAAGSVLPLGEPDRGLDDAIAHVLDRCGAGARFELALPPCADLDAALDERGWAGAGSATVLVADLHPADLHPADPGPGDEGAVRLDGGWLAVEPGPGPGPGPAIAALLRRGAAAGARHAHLAVEPGAAPAYAELGFVLHHELRWRVAPAAGR